MAVSNGILTGSFSGAGQSDALPVQKPVNLSLVFASTGTVNLERSFDQVTWLVVETYTASEEAVIDEPRAAAYRLDCDAAGGTITYRIG